MVSLDSHHKLFNVFLTNVGKAETLQICQDETRPACLRVKIFFPRFWRVQKNTVARSHASEIMFE